MSGASLKGTTKKERYAKQMLSKKQWEDYKHKSIIEEITLFLKYKQDQGINTNTSNISILDFQKRALSKYEPLTESFL